MTPERQSTKPEQSVPSPGPMEGVRVLELGDSIAVRHCTRLLAGYGADVVRVERVPLPVDAPEEHDPRYLMFNADKRSVAVDLSRDTATDVLHRLREWADITVVDEEWPSATEVRDVDGKVLTRVATFGEGPYQDWAGNDFLVMALSGWLVTQGRPDEGPTYIGGPYVSYLTGQHAAFASVAAWLHAESTGTGQTVDVTLLEVAATCMLYDHVAFAYTGKLRQRRGNVLGAPWLVLPVADGHVAVSSIPAWEEFWTILLGTDDIPVNPALAADRAERERLTEQVHERVAHLRKREFFETAQMLRVISGEVVEIDELFTSPQYTARDYFQIATTPDGTSLRYPGAPSRLSASPWRLRRSAPRPGQHTADVLRTLDIVPDAAIGATW